MSKVVKVGVMPGRIQEYAVDEQSTIASVLETAGLDATGYEVKADGTKITDLNSPVNGYNLVLLTKQVKGN